jgi:hypothetical protein
MILALDQLAAEADDECLGGDAPLLDDIDEALAAPGGAALPALELAPG